MAKMLQNIISLGPNDFEWSYERGTGPGGQKRNKTATKVRVKHEASGAVGVSDETRHQATNKRLAFSKMAKSPEMMKWLRLETARRCGDLHRVEERVEYMIAHETKIEVKVNGKWTADDGTDPEG